MQDQAYSSPSGAALEERAGNIPSEPLTLTEVISQYQAGRAAYHIREPFTPEDDKDDLAASLFHNPLDVLVGWDRPAASAPEAVLALSIALEEATVFGVGGTYAESMMRSALGFIRDMQDAERRESFDLAALRDEANRDPVVALARRLRAACTEYDVAEEADTRWKMDRTVPPADLREPQQCYDEELALRSLIASTKASSFAGAAVQVIEAIIQFGLLWDEVPEENLTWEHNRQARNIGRLLHSAYAMLRPIAEEQVPDVLVGTGYYQGSQDPWKRGEVA